MALVSSRNANHGRRSSDVQIGPDPQSLVRHAFFLSARRRAAPIVYFDVFMLSIAVAIPDSLNTGTSSLLLALQGS